MKDIKLNGLKSLRVMEERNIGVEMKKIIEKEKDMEEKGLKDNILRIERVGESKVGIDLEK